VCSSDLDGTLLDSNGNAVTELTRYTGTYTPESDVTLTAIWEVTTGGFRAQIYDDSPGTQTERYTVTLIAEDGTEYPLTSNQYGAGYRLWRVEDVPMVYILYQLMAITFHQVKKMVSLIRPVHLL